MTDLPRSRQADDGLLASLARLKFHPDAGGAAFTLSEPEATPADSPSATTRQA
jgi:hypothetical protein